MHIGVYWVKVLRIDFHIRAIINSTSHMGLGAMTNQISGTQLPRGILAVKSGGLIVVMKHESAP